MSYSMPISMTLASSRKDQSMKDEAPPWLKTMESCMLEVFGYVTETGQSWSGAIAEATFRIYTKGFDEYITERPAIEGVSEKERDRYLKQTPIWRPVACRIMEPSGWKMKEQGLWERKITNYQADENLVFQYFILSIPQTLEDARRFIDLHGLDQNEQKDLADIMREFNGTKTNNERIKKFLSRQIWHGHSPLKMIPEEVINTIESGRREAATGAQ